MDNLKDNYTGKLAILFADIWYFINPCKYADSIVWTLWKSPCKSYVNFLSTSKRHVTYLKSSCLFLHITTKDCL